MSDKARGGGDTLTGGSRSANNEMYGDAHAMSDHARGGKDTLTGGIDGANNENVRRRPRHVRQRSRRQ